MNNKEVSSIFKDRKGKSIIEYKKSAVVIPLIEIEGEANLIFEVRSLKLRRQPGDICLPGGKVEKWENYKEAAARELKEELLLKDEDFNIVGEMDYFISPYGSAMYCFVAELYKKPETYNSGEVDHLFYVPLRYFMDNEPQCYIMKIGPKLQEDFLGPKLQEDFPFHMIRGGRSYKFSTTTLNQYFYRYKEYTIWGFTAQLVKRFIDIIKKEKGE